MSHQETIERVVATLEVMAGDPDEYCEKALRQLAADLRALSVGREELADRLGKIWMQHNGFPETMRETCLKMADAALALQPEAVQPKISERSLEEFAIASACVHSVDPAVLLKILRRFIERFQPEAPVNDGKCKEVRALMNVRMMATRMLRRAKSKALLNDSRQIEDLNHILRFCKEAGIEGSILREEQQ